MRSKPEILQSLSQYLSTEILKQPGRALPENTKLITSGLVDSLRLVDLAIFIENTFAVTIDDTELNAQTFDTLGDLAELVAGRQAG